MTSNINPYVFTVNTHNFHQKQHAHSHDNIMQKNRSTCSHYGLNDHLDESCYNLHGYPPGWKPKHQRSNSQQRQNTPTSANFALIV